MLEITDWSLSLPHYPRWWKREWSPVIESLSLDIQAGEVHALVGASGSGKSLLAHALLGLLPPAARQHGTLTFQGDLLTPERQRQLRGRELALIPQTLNALDPLARSQHQIRWAARRAGLSRVSAQARSHDLLQHYQLAHAARRYPHELSGGMARRVLVAMAQAGHARVVIADEPSVGLDPAQRDRVLATLQALAKEGKAVLLITHDLRHALPIAHRVTIMRQGRAVETTSARAFHGQGEQLHSAYAKALWQALPDNAFGTLPIEPHVQEPSLA